MLGNLLEVFVYSVIYVLILVLGTKVVGAVFSPDFEKKIVESGNLGLSIVIASFFIGVALIFFSVIE
ncbi:MAG: hypothetical protein N2513_01185 [Deltaproteobacteria bacterium]|nr:hypothetical protein [Deltaproteobacteria bacterium]